MTAQCLKTRTGLGGFLCLQPRYHADRCRPYDLAPAAQVPAPRTATEEDPAMTTPVDVVPAGG